MSGPPASEIVLVTVSVAVLITETWLESGSATYKVPPLAERASPHGSWPTGIVPVTLAVAASMTSTTLSAVLVT